MITLREVYGGLMKSGSSGLWGWNQLGWKVLGQKVTKSWAKGGARSVDLLRGFTAQHVKEQEI
jgi:hypothetical protein